MKKLIIIVLFNILLFTVSGWALEISPGNTSGNPGESVIVPINISDVEGGLDIDAFSFSMQFDSDILTFNETDKTGTLTENFTLISGKLIESGRVKINGALFGTPVHIDSEGLFLKVKFSVNNTANKDSVLSMSDFKDDIATAVTSDAVFTIPHFTPIWTDNPYNPMNLWVYSITNYEIEAGDEIGIFDGDKCVGANVIDADISEQTPLIITNSQDDGNDNGFIQDHEISLRFWDAGKEIEVVILTTDFLDINGTPVTSPAFKTNEDYMVSLTLSKIGDIDHNGNVELNDVIVALKYLVGISLSDVNNDADINGDGKIGLEEVVYILQVLAGIKL
ncbi:MAG: hypothetical protein GY749_13910 [Desulfobacteraceae bacterium]|nr:hypothetical protein [Desulfobacteraceae bacterium]